MHRGRQGARGTPAPAPAHQRPSPAAVWADRDPEAAQRLSTARPLLQAKAEELNLPMENLLTPDYLRRVAWRPPSDLNEETVAAELSSLGARAVADRAWSRR